MLTNKVKPFIISFAVTVLEFIVFLIWGNVMRPGDEMGFFLITTYFLFPLTTLILSVYLGIKSPVMILPFAVLMFAAQNFMPFLLTGTFEVGMICILTFVPAVAGVLSVAIYKISKKQQ